MSTENEEMININVIVADRPYPLKIKKSEEENVRKAAKEINEKVKNYQQIYAAKDKQDYLAMTALMYAVQNMEHQSTSELDRQKNENELRSIETLLEDY